MSARAVELTRWAAGRSGDPQLEMMAAYVRAELFFTGPHPKAGLRTLDTIAGPAPPRRTPSWLAMYGALHMRGAVLAARAGMPGEAADRMTEARAAALQVPDGIYHGTAFGPSSIRIHELAAAVESGDIARALHLARRWQPPPALPAERRSHFYIEAARAHRWAAHPDQATAALWQARRAAPQHTRCNPAVSETVQALIHIEWPFLDRQVTDPNPILVRSQAGHSTGSPRQPTDRRYRRRPCPDQILVGRRLASYNRGTSQLRRLCDQSSEHGDPDPRSQDESV
jgi:hypothetical protein